MSVATPTPAADGAPARAAATTTVGLLIFLGTLAMLFAALFLAYVVMRAQAPAWPPVGVARLPRLALGLNTLLLLGATLALRASVAAARRLDPGAAVLRARGALGFGLSFLTAQIVVWRTLVGAGGGPDSGPYGSVFFAISGIHALHVLGGLVALALVVRGFARAPATAGRLRACALYWDFVLGVWGAFYLVVCL